MNFFDNYKIPGLMDNIELIWLYNTSKNMKSVVEIGSWKGKSTYTLLNGCPGVVFAIDHFKGNPQEGDLTYDPKGETDVYSEFLINIGWHERLVTMRMDNLLASKFFREKSIDMVFIDGNHSFEAVVSDIETWKPICKKLLCGHDVCHAPVADALQYCDIPYTVVPVGDRRLWYYEMEDKS